MSTIKPEPPHGALGELRARTQTSSMNSLENRRPKVLSPKVDQPSKPPRKTRTGTVMAGLRPKTKRGE
jgi:hypothetical protein